jgi:hypothetical protein
MTNKRTQSILRKNPIHFAAVALVKSNLRNLSETNKSHAHKQTPDEYEYSYDAAVYDSDDDNATQQETSSSSTATSSSTPIVSDNSATPIVSGNSATATVAAVVLDSPLAQSAATLVANANSGQNKWATLFQATRQSQNVVLADYNIA